MIRECQKCNNTKFKTVIKNKKYTCRNPKCGLSYLGEKVINYHLWIK